MDSQSIFTMLGHISRLIIRAQQSRSAAERAAATRELKICRASLKASVREMEDDVEAGINRKVEAAAYRAAIATLDAELAAIEAAEDQRVQTTQ